MSERDGYQPGVPCWVQTVQPEPKQAVRFYTELFGWDAVSLMGEDSPGDYFLCKLRGRDVAAIVSQHGAPAPPEPVWVTHIWVDSADDIAAKVAEAGGSVVGEPFDSPGGARVAVLSDPAGAVFCVWQPLERGGAQLVNEPNAWAMSQLRTPDPDPAKAFYGEVFGWETDTFGAGEGEVTLWRVPGYVGGEPQQPVSREVVGAMFVIGEERCADEPPPHWSVDFWVSDADATAADASRLGGRVILASHEAPGFRRAILADPFGAAFSVSELIVPT